jgi:flavin-binding protein dodecin
LFIIGTVRLTKSKQKPERKIKVMRTKRTRRNKGKELIAVAAVCVLSIGAFSGAYIALNDQIFARATSEPTLLAPPPEVAESENYTEPENDSILDQSPAVAASYTDSGAEYVPENVTKNETDEFVVPALTVMASPDQESAIPAVAMSIEDAAQTGARYIWDVFGSNIDGMYVRMFYGDHASQINTWWVGNVFVENPENPMQNYVVHPVTYEKRALPIYTFVINAITGQRIDVSYINPQGIPENIYISPEVMLYRGDDDSMSFRWALLESGWFDMDVYEQIELLGMSDESLEAYLQTAKKLAEAQFNTTGVSNVQLDTFWANGMIDGVVDLATIVFVALDSTGREAIITISASDAAFQSINISTQHNDFVPGFEFYYPGGGVG